MGARLFRLVVWGIVALLVAAAGLVWLAGRPETLAWAARHASRLTDGRLAVEGVTGSLFRELSARSVRWQDGPVVVTVDTARIAYQPLALLDGRVVVEFASATRVTVDLPAAGEKGPALPPPPAMAGILPVTVHWLELGEVSIRRAGVPTVMFEGVEAALRHDGDRFQVNPLRVDVTAAGHRVTVRGDASTFARAPYATDGRFVLQLPAGRMPLRVDVRLNGPIEAMAVRASTLLAGAPVEARSELRAFEPRPLRRMRLEVKDLDLAAFDRSLPVTRLTGTYDAEVMPAWASEPRPMLIGPLALTNAAPGALDVARLPVATAKAVVGFAEGRIQFQELRASGPMGDVSGDGWALLATQAEAAPAFHLALASDALHLRGLDRRLAPRTMKGRLAVDPAKDGAPRRAAQVRLEASDAALVAELQGEIDGMNLRLQRASIAAAGGDGGGRTQLAGDIGLVAPWPVALAGGFRDFDPSQLVTMPTGRLNGSWRLDGRLAGDAGGQLRAEVALSDSRLRGLALAGVAAATLTTEGSRIRRLDEVDARLAWGVSTVRASGALGEAADTLSVALESRDAGELVERLDGALAIRADLRGPLRAPTVQASIDGKRLAFAEGGWRADIPAAAIEVTSDRPRSGFAHVKARLDGVTVIRLRDAAAFPLGRVVADVAGTERQHVGEVQVEASGQRLLLRARGGLVRDGAWLGNVQALEASHPWLRVPVSVPGPVAGPRPGAPAQPDLRALQPFVLEVGRDRAIVRDARFALQDAQVSLRSADWRGTDLSLRADATGLPAGWLARLPDLRRWRDPRDEVPAGTMPVAFGPSDLRLAVSVDFHGDLADSTAADWAGTLLVRRESGDLMLAGDHDGAARNAGLQALMASASIDARVLRLVLDVAGGNIGRIGLEARARLRPGDDPVWSRAALARSPLEGRLDVATAALPWVSPVSAGRWRIDGALGAQLRLAGTVGRPRADGVVTGSGLTAHEPALGLRLANGVLAAEFAGERIDVKLLRFESGEGSVAVSGLLQAPHSARKSEARIVLDRLAVPLGPGQRVVLSGSTVASLRDDALSVTGRLLAEEGLVILDRPAPARPPSPEQLARADAPAADTTPAEPAVALDRSAVRKTGVVVEEERPRPFRMETALELDLGPRFRVRGEGLDTRVTGSLRVQGELPHAPEANGTIALVDGGWRLPGRRLAIAHGRVVFDGPLDDPAIDIVARRDGVASQPGVAITGTASAPVLTLVRGDGGPGDAERLSRQVLGGQPAQAKEAERVLAATGARLGPRLVDTWQRSLRGVWEVLRLQYEIADRLSLSVQAGSEGAAELLELFPLD